MKTVNNLLVKYVGFVLLNLIAVVLYGLMIIPFAAIVTIELISIVLVMALILHQKIIDDFQKQINELKSLMTLLNLLERDENNL